MKIYLLQQLAHLLYFFDLALFDCPLSLRWRLVQAILRSERVLVPTLCEPRHFEASNDSR